MIKIIVAYDLNRGIGLNGKMPWHIPEDLKLFKRLTMGSTIVFGKTTFMGIGKVLPGRKHIIVTHDIHLKDKFPEIELVDDFQSFLKDVCQSGRDVIICGGASLYKQALPFAQELSLSLIKQAYPCDTFFPPIDFSDYDILSKTEYPDFNHLVLRKKTHEENHLVP